MGVRPAVPVPAGQQYRFVFVCIDTVTRYVWLCTFRGKLSNRKTARCMERVVKDVRERYGGWFPGRAKTTVQSDNGKSDFGSEFTRVVQALEPRIKHTHGVANNPNSQALAEGAVGILRGVLRRMFRAYDSSDWPSMLQEAGAIMNQRKNAALAYTAPADLVDAFQDGDQAVVDRAMAALRDRAAKRRGPGGTVDTALAVSTPVRLANLAYMKSKGFRGNTLKTIPRWSQRVWTVTRRRGGGAAPYQYKLDNGKPEWYAQELLQVTRVALKAPDVASEQKDEYEISRVLQVRGGNAQVLYRGYPTAEWTPIGNVPANLLPA